MPRREYPNATFERLMNTRVAREDRFQPGDKARINVGAAEGSIGIVTQVWLENNRYCVRVAVAGDELQFFAADLSNLTHV